MDIPTRRREIFFNNLLLLGFDKAAVEKEYRVSCDKNMFCLPNQQMFEIVTYFLFSKLKEVSEEKFSLPWPLLDREQRREFQKTCIGYLTTIAQRSSVEFPRIVPSQLSTFGGDYLYELYLTFSSHVIQKCISRNNNTPLIKMPTVDYQNESDAVETLKIATILSVEKFKEIQAFSHENLKLLLTCSNDLMTNIKKLKSSLVINRSLLEEEKRNLSSLVGNSEITSIAENIIQTMDYEKKVRKYWRHLDEFISKEKDLWNHVCSQVEDNIEKNILDGAVLTCDVSSVIKEQCPDINEIGFHKTEENTSVCLLKYLKVFRTVLEYYTKNLMHEDLSQMAKSSPIKNSLTLDESLNNVKTLNEKLGADTVPSIKDNTKRLQEALFLDQCTEEFESFLNETPSWMFSSKELYGKLKNTRMQTFPALFTDDAEESLLLGNSALQSIEDISLNSRFSSFKSTSELLDNLNLEQRCLVPDNSESNVPLNDDANGNEISDNGSLQEEKVDLSCVLNLKVPREGDSTEEDPFQSMVSCSSNRNVEASSEKTKFSLLDLDFDIDYKKPFEMRESWKLEDSLDSVSLQDASIGESFY